MQQGNSTAPRPVYGVGVGIDTRKWLQQIEELASCEREFQQKTEDLKRIEGRIQGILNNIDRSPTMGSTQRDPKNYTPFAICTGRSISQSKKKNLSREKARTIAIEKLTRLATNSAHNLTEPPQEAIQRLDAQLQEEYDNN